MDMNPYIKNVFGPILTMKIVWNILQKNECNKMTDSVKKVEVFFSYLGYLIKITLFH